MSVIGRGTTVDSDNLPTELMLPPGSFAAWSAIFQNLLTNAFRATAEVHPGRVTIDGGAGPSKGWIRFQDNGSGMNLEIAEELFLPFERAAESSEKAEALGLGGSGLGLTIVRMITDELRCVVAFETPDLGWATAATITWKV
ncbi:ATP-binding protein [Ornithinimicrobium sp. INDO-MA30-4]|uniref:ATP-binding protein n=1 Tax=Ornithinimicrobium sp. INDO-MA30-4 TaxID=2908651 RepID=UPI001F1D3FC8|nr:ATP-binding protein [Ornithinimicrobium sp. INDO-MA30-4]UJH71737.1 ATP-binding protein [Ornithinimicrobium sp. INDO-MA30-4]